MSNYTDNERTILKKFNSPIKRKDLNKLVLQGAIHKHPLENKWEIALIDENTRLKPCPFCAGEAELECDGFTYYYIQCLGNKAHGSLYFGKINYPDGGCCGFYKTKEEAIKAWNNRPAEKGEIIMSEREWGTAIYEDRHIALLDMIKPARWYTLEELRKQGWSISDLNLLLTSLDMIANNTNDKWRITIARKDRKIKLCPYCLYEYEVTCKKDSRGYYMLCTNDECRTVFGHFDTAGDAIRSWNIMH